MDDHWPTYSLPMAREGGKMVQPMAREDGKMVSSRSRQRYLQKVLGPRFSLDAQDLKTALTAEWVKISKQTTEKLIRSLGRKFEEIIQGEKKVNKNHLSAALDQTRTVNAVKKRLAALSQLTFAEDQSFKKPN